MVKYMEKGKKLIFLIFLVFYFYILISFVYGAECNDPNKIITYSPNDLEAGMPFNLTFIDLFNENGEIYLYLPPAINIINGSNPANLIQYGNGTGYYTWILNSSEGGKYNISVEVRYVQPVCNVTREIEIKPFAGKPNLVVNFYLPSLIIAEKQNPAILNIKNIGNGNAYYISGNIYINSFANIIKNFYISNLTKNNETNQSFNIANKYCGYHSLFTVISYKDGIGSNYMSKNSTNIEIKGAKLNIFAKFYKGNNELQNGSRVYKGSRITLKANITNRGNYYAENSKIFIYEDGRLRKTVELGNINVNENKYNETYFELTRIGNVELKVIIDSNSDCENNPYLTAYSINIKVVEEETPPSGGGGGGGGSGTNQTYICGNNICEINLGENSSNCPQDCKPLQQPIYTPPQQPSQNYVEIISDDGLVILKLNRRTIIKDKNGNRINWSEINITRIRDLTLIPMWKNDIYLVRAYKISPEVTFDLPGELIFSYGDEILKDANLFIYKFVGDWQELKTNWNKEERKIKTEIYSTAIFGLFTDKITYPPITGGAIGILNWLKEKWYIPLIIILAIINIFSISLIFIKRKRTK